MGAALVGTAVLAAAVPPAMASSQSANQAKCKGGAPGIAVGDSVLDAVEYTGGKEYLQKFLGGSSATVDGDVNRQFSDGAAIIKSAVAANRKACAVVVSLGTNGPVKPAEWSGLLTSLKSVPRVVVVNTYTKAWRSGQNWMPRMNADIAGLPRTFRNVRVADWYTAAQKLGSTDLPDGVHPDTKKAAYAWVNTVAAALNKR